MENLQVSRLDHLGIVSGVIDDLGLVEAIDRRLQRDKNGLEEITPGEAIKGMILNGLGELGLDETGLARTPRMTVKEYNQAVKGLTLQSTQSTILASLGYIMLGIAVVASPYLAITGALTVPGAVLFAQATALTSWGMFSKANEDPGRRCLDTMKKMINTKDHEDALKQLFHVQPEESSWPTAAFYGFCNASVTSE